MLFIHCSCRDSVKWWNFSDLIMSVVLCRTLELIKKTDISTEEKDVTEMRLAVSVIALCATVVAGIRTLRVT